MSNWSGRDVAGLLRSVELAFCGSSWLFYWFFIYIGVSSAISIIELYLTTGLSDYVVVMRIVYTLVSMGVALYGAYLLRRGVEGIGRYYNNPDLISRARLQFVAWIIVAAMPISYHYYNYVSYITGAVVVIGLILLGLSMRKITEILYELTGIDNFDVAEDEWKWTAYLAIVFVGFVAVPFATYNTRKGFNKMVRRVAEQGAVP